MIRAVKGTRDLLPPSTAVWNHVEAVARSVFRAYNYHEIRTPMLEETQLFARGVGEETDIVTQGNVHLRRPRRHLADAAAGEHGVGDSRLYRAPAGPASGRAEALLHGSDVPPRASAERALPAVLSDRRGGHRIGIARRRCRSDRDGGARSCAASGLEGFQPAAEFGGLLRTAGRSIVELLREELAGRGAADVRAIASAARTPIRCACSIARCRSDQPIIDKLPSILDHLCEACRPHFDAVQQYLRRSRDRITKSSRAWCAGSTTTCARRSKSCTARWARRIRCWAAAATTGWRNRWDRKCPRRASGSRSAKTGW